MDDQLLTVALFVIAQILTIGLALAGWVFATRLTIKQLNRQHADALRLDEERIRREMTLSAVMELIQRLQDWSDAATQVAGTMGGMGMAAHSLHKNQSRDVVFVERLVPEFTRAWRELQTAGGKVSTALSSYEPILTAPTAERRKLIGLELRIIACEAEHAHAFLHRVTEWDLEEDKPERKTAVIEALTSCQSEFDPIHADLSDAIISFQTRLKNEQLSPIFGHSVEQHGGFKGSVWGILRRAENRPEGEQVPE